MNILFILGKTYFFKDEYYYEFDDMRMRTRPNSPRLSAEYWLGCPPSRIHIPDSRGKSLTPDNRYGRTEDEDYGTDDWSTDDGVMLRHSYVMLIMTLLVISLPS